VIDQERAHGVPELCPRIVSYEWFEDFGSPGQKSLGTGETARIPLPLSSHQITLRVTDSFGEADTAAMGVRVVDTTAPRLSRGTSQVWRISSSG